MIEKKLRKNQIMRKGDILRYLDGDTLDVGSLAGQRVDVFFLCKGDYVFRPQKNKVAKN